MATRRTPAATPIKTAPTASKAVKAVRQSLKPAPKAAAKPAPRDQEDKPRKPKMVRDSFTMPKDEYAVIALLKERAAKSGRPAKKSELLRAGITLLERLPAKALVAALQALPAVKTGRPAKA